MKAAFAGFLAGVALVLVIAKLLHGPPPETSVPDPAGSAAPPREGSPAVNPDDLAPLREKAASLRDESARLAASLQQLASTPAGAASARTGRRKRRDVGADLLNVFGPDGESNNALYTRARMDLALLTGDAADKEGVTPTEAKLSPQVLEEVFLGMREACPGGIAEAEAEALRAALDAYRRDWDAWKAEGRSADGFERAAGLMDIQREAREALFGAVDAETSSRLREAMDGIDQNEVYSFGTNLYSEKNDHAETLVECWVADLGLGESALVALRPLAEEFARENPPRDWSYDGPAGTRVLVESRKDLLAMSKVRKRIREVASLTPEQAKSLEAWQKVYSLSKPGESTFEPAEGGR